MNTDIMKIFSMLGIGYMVKSLIVTFGQTSENLTSNLILLTGCLAVFIIAVREGNNND